MIIQKKMVHSTVGINKEIVGCCLWRGIKENEPNPIRPSIYGMYDWNGIMMMRIEMLLYICILYMGVMKIEMSSCHPFALKASSEKKNRSESAWLDVKLSKYACFICLWYNRCEAKYIAIDEPTGWIHCSVSSTDLQAHKFDGVANVWWTFSAIR